MCKDGSKKYVQVHRLVAEYFCDGYFDGAVVNHKDGDKHNNNHANLEWVSQKENIHKSYNHSNKGPKRNFYKYELRDSDGTPLGEFYGVPDAIKFCKDSGIKISESSMKRNRKSNGLVLIKID